MSNSTSAASSEPGSSPDPAPPRAVFVTTHWSQVLAAANQALPNSDDALEKLCRAYWYPLYAYVRRRGHSPDDAGIVHRDIKPENILLDKRGRVKIADFGLAKLLGVEAGPGERLTQSQQVMGTPHYMAPEQIKRPTEVDHRADIYSLGVVFYEMLTGELPIGRFAPPSRRVTVDVRLDEVVLRALEKEPEQRYQQASQVKAEVETIATTPPSATPSSEEAHAANPGKEPRLVVPETTTHVSTSRSLGRRLAIAAGVALTVFVVTVVATSVITFSRPKTYVSIAKVMLRFQGILTSQDVEAFRSTPAAQVRSDLVLSQVASNLNLGQRGSGRLGDPELDNYRAISLLRERIEVRPVPGTTILQIISSADSPQEAMEIAEQVTDVFRRTAGAAGVTVLQGATPPQVRSPDIWHVLVALVLVAPLLALSSGVVAFAIVTKRSRAASPLVEPTRPTSSGAVWAWAAVGIAVVMVFLALAAGSAMLAIYLPARARQRVEVTKQAELVLQARMIHQQQEAEATAHRDGLLRSLDELHRQGLTDMHPEVQRLRAEIANLESAATNRLDGSTNLTPSEDPNR